MNLLPAKLAFEMVGTEVELVLLQMLVAIVTELLGLLLVAAVARLDRGAVVVGATVVIGVVEIDGVVDGVNESMVAVSLDGETLVVGDAIVGGVKTLEAPLMLVPIKFSKPRLGINSSNSWSDSASAVIMMCAIRVASAEPRIVIIRSFCPFCFSTSICAPDHSRIWLMLQPPRPITRLMTLAGTLTFFDFRLTSFQPSSRFC